MNDCKGRMLFLTFSLFLMGTVFTYADDRHTTPYGDYCRECGNYGMCTRILSPKEAFNALCAYYTEKGYRVGEVFYKGRFIEAEIWKDDVQVDKILFDRKTGRLRSIY